MGTAVYDRNSVIVYVNCLKCKRKTVNGIKEALTHELAHVVQFSSNG